MEDVGTDILDAISILINQTPGDVNQLIQKHGFETIAKKALRSFLQKHTLELPLIEESKEDTIEDLKILKDCLKELQEELKIETSAKKRQEIIQDIADIKTRIQMEL